MRKLKFNWPEIKARFAFPAVLSILSTIISLILVARESDPDSINFEIKLLLSLGFGIILTLVIQLVSERYKLSATSITVANALGVVASFAYIFGFIAYGLEENEDISLYRLAHYVAVATILTIAVFVAPYLSLKRGNDESRELWHFATEVLKRLIGTYFFSFVLFAGLSFALLIIENLLEVNVDSKLYAYLSILLFSLFSPLYFLGDIPKNFQVSTDNTKFSKYSKFFGIYVLIPLVTIYTIILYIYEIKLLFEGELPENQIVYIIISFLTPGFLAILVIFPLKYVEETRWVAKYIRFFSISALPLLGLYFYSLYLRIDTYGFTVSRTLGIYLGLAILTVCLIYVFSKKAYLRVIPITYMVFIFLAICMPFFNAFTIGEYSQKKILEQLFEKYNILEDGKYKQTEEIKVNNEDYYRMESILQYLENTHGLNSLKDWFTESQWEDFDLDNNGKDTYRLRSEFLNKINVVQSESNLPYNNYSFDKNNISFLISVGYEQQNNPISIKGYDQYFDLSLARYNRNPQITLEIDESEYNVDMSLEDTKLIINIDGKEISTDLSDEISDIIEDNGSDYEYDFLDIELATRDALKFEQKAGKLKFLIVVDQVSGKLKINNEGSTTIDEVEMLKANVFVTKK